METYAFNIFQEYSHKGKSTFHHLWPLCNSIQELDADIYVISPLFLPAGWWRFKENLWGGPCRVSVLTYEWCWWKKLKCFFEHESDYRHVSTSENFLSIFLKISIGIKFMVVMHTKHFICACFLLVCLLLVRCDLDPFLWGIS